MQSEKKMHEFRILLITILVFHQCKSSEKDYCDKQCLCYKDNDHLDFLCERATSPLTHRVHGGNTKDIVAINPSALRSNLEQHQQGASKRKPAKIIINESNLTSIGHHTLWGLTSLRFLDLSTNNISSLTEDNFKGQQNLLELDLSSNQLTSINPGTFKFLIELHNLNLARNQIDSLHAKSFHMLTKLRVLDLSENPLEDLEPDCFKDITDLGALKCRGCQLQHINPQVYNLLKHLSHLDLGNNQLKYLDKDEFADLKSLKQIHLDGNQLSVVIDNLFSRQKLLQYLDISRNRLAKISEKAFVNLKNLSYLDVSYNQLRLLSFDIMHHLQRLKTLNISGNFQMSLIESKLVFQNLTELRTLAIADTRNLPLGIFTPLHTRLLELNVSGIELNSESLHMLKPLTNLKLLDVSRNLLKGFEDDFIELLMTVDDVRFDQNPFVCDLCNMDKIFSRITMMRWQSVPACYQPEELRGITIDRLETYKAEICHGHFIEEGKDAASTLHILNERRFGFLAFIAISICTLVVLIFIIIIVLFLRQRRNASSSTENIKRSSSKSCKIIIAEKI